MTCLHPATNGFIRSPLKISKGTPSGPGLSLLPPDGGLGLSEKALGHRCQTRGFGAHSDRQLIRAPLGPPSAWLLSLASIHCLVSKYLFRRLFLL